MIFRFVSLVLIACLISGMMVRGDVATNNFKKANDQIEDIRKLVAGKEEPKELQWNRYVSKNFEILSLDDPQGKYLKDNVEFIKTWILWRWGIQDIDLVVKCKLICVPSQELYEKLFNRKNSDWRVDKDGYNVWLITDGQKWNTKLPVYLTEVILNNLEIQNKTKLPVWTHRGISLLNGRIEDIRNVIPSASGFSSNYILNMTPDAYAKLTDEKKVVFDAQAAVFCLWARKEFNGKVFLDFMSGSTINPEYCLQYFGLNTFAECDIKVKTYLDKLPSGADYYFTW